MSAHQEILSESPTWLRLSWYLSRPLRWLRRLARTRPSILIVRMGLFGDLLLLTGVLAFLRRTYPKHRIVVITCKTYRPVIETSPDIDQLLVLPPTGDGSLWSRFSRIWTGICLLGQSYDMAAYPTYQTHRLGHYLCGLSQATRTFTFNGHAAEPDEATTQPSASWYTEIVPVDRDRHVLDKHASLLQAMTGKTTVAQSDLEPVLCFTDEDRRVVDVTLPTKQPGERLTVTICPGANNPRRLWPLVRFVELMELLASEKPVLGIFLGTRHEREPLDAALGSVTMNPHLTLLNLAGRLSVRQSLAAIARSDLCIGNDTLGLHAAVALGIPSVVIMGGGTYPQYNPWRDSQKHRMAQLPMDCYRCDWHCKFEDPLFPCIDAVTVESVYQEARMALQTIMTASPITS